MTDALLSVTERIMAMVIKYLNKIRYTGSAQYIEAISYHRGEVRQVAGFIGSISLHLQDFKRADVTREMAYLVLGKPVTKLNISLKL